METIKQDYSVSMAKANVMILPAFLGLFLGMAGIYRLIWGTFSSGGFFDGWQFWVVFIVGIIVHEGIHGFTWMIAGNIPVNQIKYGVQWKTLTPYAHSKIPMPKSAYQIGAALPGIILGVLPYILGLTTGNAWVVYFGILFTTAALGDALILWLIRDVDSNMLVEDHSTQAGCYVIEAV